MLIPIWGASGVGKTTLALALSKALIAEGKTVLLISPEPYSELSAIGGVEIPTEQSLQTAIRTGNLMLCLKNQGGEDKEMADTKNLCAQIPLALHQKVCENKEQSGLTLNQYVTLLITEYYELKEMKPTMTQTRTLALQISEELFARIKKYGENPAPNAKGVNHGAYHQGA